MPLVLALAIILGVLINGQSNAAGTAVPAAEDHVPVERLFAAYTGDRLPEIVSHASKKHARFIRPAVEPIGYGTAATKMGPGRAAGVALVAAWPEHDVLLIPMATGGTAITYTSPLTYEWAPPVLSLQEMGVEIVGILFHQGETESAKPAGTYTEAEHAAALDLYLAQWRAWLGKPCLPLVAGDLAQTLSAGSYPSQGAVRAALADWPARDAAGGGCGTVASVSSVDAESQGAHFTARGYREMGARYAAALAALVTP